MVAWMLLGIAIGLGIFGAGYGIGRLHRSWIELRRQIDQLQRDLDTSQQITRRQRHTHATIAGIEDATAVLIDMLLEADAFKARADTALRYLGVLRKGPNAYSLEEEDGDE